MFYCFLCLIFLQTASAHVGQILGLPAETSYLMRGKERISLVPSLELLDKDSLYVEGNYVQIFLYPNSQIALTKGSVIHLGPYLKAPSVVDLIKGNIRLTTSKGADFKIQTKGVSFSVKDADCEIFLSDEFVDLDVYHGEVEVTSPDVHTFVPEIVKAKQGFRFNKKSPAFSRREFKPKLNDVKLFEKDLLKKLSDKTKRARNR